MTDPDTQQQGMRDRSMYDAGPGAKLASPTENARVRALYTKHLDKRVADDPRDISYEAKYGFARGHFAHEWPWVAEELGIHVPGADQRTPTSGGHDTPEHRKKDAAHTILRQFKSHDGGGTDQLKWVLDGIEATICIRDGQPLPRLDTQPRLDLDGQ